MKWYSIGAFTFPSSWGALVIAFLVTGVFLRLYYGKGTNEWFGNSVFWFIVTWKLSVILFDFSTFIKQPLSVIYFHGGVQGFWLGIAVVLVYVYLHGRRDQLITSWVLIVLVYEGAAGYLANTASIWGAVNILVGLGIFYLILKSGKSSRWWLLLFIGFQLLFNFMQGDIVSNESGAYAVITISVLLMNQLRREVHE